jgi:succinoglycan biosynthesis protein ExoA
MPADAAPASLPAVSVIMTALNEAAHLEGAVASIAAQDYAGQFEIVIAIGPSQDGTWDLAQRLATTYPRVRVVENPAGRTPAGLNVAIAATDPASTVIVRSDGHAELPVDYVSTAVATLERSGADNVGGMMIPRGEAPLESAVAKAMSERVGLGGASFHVGGQEGPAPTVYLGSFRRSILERTGGYDEYYTRAQDWELNYRIRAAGGVVWFNPAMQVGYRPRAKLRALATQFRGSGEWRWKIVHAYPETASLRYLAAPFVTLAVLAGLIAAVVGAVVGSTAVWTIGLAVPAVYVLGVIVAAMLTRRGLGLGASLWYPVALITMHLAWGTGFLIGVVKTRLLGDTRPKPARTPAGSPS